MKNILLLATILANTLIVKSQTLGGYNISDYLITAVHPDGCNSGYVTHLPDDSIWVNFQDYDTMSGNFSQYSIDAAGYDLLLETGFNRSSYMVSLLLSTGLYSATHQVAFTDWDPIPGVFWKYIYYPPCSTGSQNGIHLILPLDFNLDFSLTPTDTVIGIKIVFLPSPPGNADLAGVYIIEPQTASITATSSNSEIYLYYDPLTDNINISTTNNISAEITVYDIESRKLLQQQFTNSTSINTEQLAKGIYIYEVRNKNGVIKKGKVVKD